MSAAIRTVVVGDLGEATYDSDMTVGSLKGLLGSASGEGNLDGLIDSLAEFVETWPFAGSPANSEDWDNLRRSEFNDLVSAVIEDIGSLGEA